MCPRAVNLAERQVAVQDLPVRVAELLAQREDVTAIPQICDRERVPEPVRVCLFTPARSPIRATNRYSHIRVMRR